jgi:prolipoprotein diacylglyceryltransferase
VIGALMGGYLGVEIAKKLVGIRHSTGDAFAVAVPLSLGIGRIACVLGGCCYGTPSHQPWAIHLAGADRHPVQLYEAALDFALAAAVFSVRSPLRSRTQGCASTPGSRTPGCTSTPDSRTQACASTIPQAREPGVLWRLSLIGYAGIRLLLDPWRGDARLWLGPVSAVQVLCALAICALWLVPRAMQTARSNG